MIVKQTFDAYAVEYEEKFNRNPLGRYQRERVHQVIAPYLQNCRRILDVGCGPGSDFEFFRKFDLVVEALDISEKMIGIAKERAALLGLPVRLHCRDFRQFQTDCRYDLILLDFGVVNVFDDLALVCRKIKALLAPGGAAVIVSMPPLHLFSALENLLCFQLRKLWRRLFGRVAELPNGLKIYYYREPDLARYFSVTARIPLGPLLPTPDQYARWRAARWYARQMMTIDQKLAGRLPDALGGDHVCYVLKESRPENLTLKNAEEKE